MIHTSSIAPAILVMLKAVNKAAESMAAMDVLRALSV